MNQKCATTGHLTGTHPMWGPCPDCGHMGEHYRSPCTGCLAERITALEERAKPEANE